MHDLREELHELLPKGTEQVSILLERKDKVSNIFGYCRAWLDEQDELFKCGEALMNLTCFADISHAEGNRTIEEWVKTDRVLQTWYAKLA